MEFDDAPEKRIRELERGLSDATPVALAWEYGLQQYGDLPLGLTQGHPVGL